MVGLYRGVGYWAYIVAGSRAARDPKLRKQFFAEVFRKVGLPMEVIDDARGFTVVHSQGGNVWCSCRPTAEGEGPKTVKCFLGNVEGRELVSLMERSLEELSSKRLEYEWCLSKGNSAKEPDLAVKVYHLAAELPAMKKYNVDFSYVLSGIEGLDVLRKLCTRKAKFSTRLCSFLLPHDDTGELTVCTTKEGHFLELNLRDSRNLAFVNERLGVTF
jgi:hypothetical protein